MAVSEALQIDEDNTEKTISGKLQNSWTKLDKLLLVFGILVNLGDGVELYLPGMLHWW